MQDRTIDSALLNLRKQMIRGDGAGLEHVETLLRMRGVDMPRVLPPKRPDAARRGQMQALILEALRDGPKPFRAIVDHVAHGRSEISYEAAYVRTGQRLDAMKHKGLVVGVKGRMGRFEWSLLT